VKLQSSTTVGKFRATAPTLSILFFFFFFFFRKSYKTSTYVDDIRAGLNFNFKWHGLLREILRYIGERQLCRAGWKLI